MYLCGYVCMSADPDGGQTCWLLLVLVLQMVVNHLIGCCERNSSPLEEQQVHITAAPSLQPQKQLSNASAPLLPSVVA